MNVVMMSKTKLTESFKAKSTFLSSEGNSPSDNEVTALTAIRNCYSPLKPSEIIDAEGQKYFGNDGAESKRLFNQIVKSSHTSTLEHIHFVFIVEDVSRALMAQLTRSRHMGYSIKSQRYVRYGSRDKSGGFDFVKAPSMDNNDEAEMIFYEAMHEAQRYYDELRAAGVPAEDARAVLPNAATTQIVLSCNLRAVLEFYSKRRMGGGAQWEIATLAEKIRELVEQEEPWTKSFFEVIK